MMNAVPNTAQDTPPLARARLHACGPRPAARRACHSLGVFGAPEGNWPQCVLRRQACWLPGWLPGWLATFGGAGDSGQWSRSS